MYVENPGVDMFRKDLLIVETPNSAAGMRKVLPKIANLVKKLVEGEEVLGPKEEGYIERGIRVNYFAEKRGSDRAIDMLLKKIRGEEYVTEYEMPVFDRVDPAEPVKDIKNATIAIVTSGGVVPTGNPDHIESSNATKYGEYSIAGMETMSKDDFTTIHGGYDRQFVMENPNLVVPLDVLRELEKEGEYSIAGMETMSKDDFTTIHGGYDRQFVMENPNLVVPLDVLRELEKEGAFGKLYDSFFTTTGTGTATGSAAKFGVMENPNLVVPLDVLRELEKEGAFGKLYDSFFTTTGTGTATGSAAKFGDDIGKKLIADGVDAVILVSTWGTCTRCGATMVKGIEKYGIPVVHMATVVPISLTIGANRIIPGVGIPYPLGDPTQGEVDSKKIRMNMVKRALKVLQTPVDGQTVFETDDF